ncbi:hypothetical protein RZN25_17695 [Bacillaceae bacterium S4-13-56]
MDNIWSKMFPMDQKILEELKKRKLKLSDTQKKYFDLSLLFVFSLGTFLWFSYYHFFHNKYPDLLTLIFSMGQDKISIIGLVVSFYIYFQWKRHDLITGDVKKKFDNLRIEVMDKFDKWEKEYDKVFLIQLIKHFEKDLKINLSYKK